MKFVLSAAAPKASAISLQIISSLVNPSSTKTVSSFAISTYDASDFSIDQINAGISITMKYSAAFSNIVIAPDSKTNSAITNYKFTITQPSAIEAGGILRIVFPATVIPQSDVSCSPTCTSIGSNTLRVVLPAITSNTAFDVTVSRVKNPPSFAESAVFAFNSYASDGTSAYSNDSSHKIQNNVPSTILSVPYTFTPKIYGSTATTLSFSFTPTYSQI